MAHFQIELRNDDNDEYDVNYSLKLTFSNGGLTSIITIHEPFLHTKNEYKKFIENVRKSKKCSISHIRYESPYLYSNGKINEDFGNECSYDIKIDLTDIHKDFCDKLEELVMKFKK